MSGRNRVRQNPRWHENISRIVMLFERGCFYPRAKPGFHWGSRFDLVHPTLPTRLSTRPDTENNCTPRFLAPIWDHPAAFSIASHLKPSEYAPKKVRAMYQDQDTVGQRACAQSRLSSSNGDRSCRSRLVTLSWWILDVFRVGFRSI